MSGSSRRRGMTMRRPYDRDWQRVRKRHLAQHPTCVRCGAPGLDVDHITTVRAAPHRRLDPTNLQTLCHSCHSRLTQLYDVRGIAIIRGIPHAAGPSGDLAEEACSRTRAAAYGRSRGCMKAVRDSDQRCLRTMARGLLLLLARL